MGKIYDVHVHVGDSAALYVAGSGNITLDKMNENHVDGAAISPIPGFEDPRGVADAKSMNRMIYDMKAAHPDRYVIGLGVAEPNHGKGALEEVEHALGELKLDGIMFHNDFNGVEVDAPVMFDIFRKISEFKDAKVMLHTAFQSNIEHPYMIGRLAEKFPDIRIVIGHPLMTLVQSRAVIELLKWYPGLYIDTCYTYHHSYILESLVEEIGSHRMMFGSDNPYYGSLCLDKVLIETAKISDRDKENILGHTFEQFFDLQRE